MYLIQTNLKKILIAFLIIFIIIFSYFLFVYFKNSKTKNNATITPTPTIKIIDSAKNYKESNLSIKVNKSDFKVDLNGTPIFIVNKNLPLNFYVNSREQLVDSFKFKVYFDSNKMSFLRSVNKLNNYNVSAVVEAKKGYIQIIGEKKDKAKALKDNVIEIQFLPLKEGSSFLFIKNDAQENFIMIGENNIFKKAIGLSLIFNNQ